MPRELKDTGLFICIKNEIHPALKQLPIKCIKALDFQSLRDPFLYQHMKEGLKKKVLLKVVARETEEVVN